MFIPFYSYCIILLYLSIEIKNATAIPSLTPTTKPSAFPTKKPSVFPTGSPTSKPTSIPSGQPSSVPSYKPSSKKPTCIPTITKAPQRPTLKPSKAPRQPTAFPTLLPKSVSVTQNLIGVHPQNLTNVTSPSTFRRLNHISIESNIPVTSSQALVVFVNTIIYFLPNLKQSNIVINSISMNTGSTSSKPITTISYTISLVLCPQCTNVTTILTNSNADGNFSKILQSLASTNNVASLTKVTTVPTLSFSIFDPYAPTRSPSYPPIPEATIAPLVSTQMVIIISVSLVAIILCFVCSHQCYKKYKIFLKTESENVLIQSFKNMMKNANKEEDDDDWYDSDDDDDDDNGDGTKKRKSRARPRVDTETKENNYFNRFLNSSHFQNRNRFNNKDPKKLLKLPNSNGFGMDDIKTGGINQNDFYTEESAHTGKLSSLYPEGKDEVVMHDKMELSKVVRDIMSNDQQKHMNQMYTRMSKNPLRLVHRSTTGGIFERPM